MPGAVRIIVNVALFHYCYNYNYSISVVACMYVCKLCYGSGMCGSYVHCTIYHCVIFMMW